MSAARSLAAAAVACAAVLVFSPGAPTARPAGTCVRPASWPATSPVLAQTVVQLVNAHRRALHRQTLSVSASLTRSASWKASHMARYEYMQHNDPAPPVKRTVAARLAACGYPTTRGAWGENIAYGYETPADVMRAWLKSPGHRRNIESRLYAAIGVGVAKGDDGLLYWAQNFGSTP